MKKVSNNKEEILNLAILNHKQNNFHSAEELYKKILNIDPNHIEAIFLLGTMSIQTKNFDKAQDLLKKVIQLKPEHSKAHNNLGTTFQELKKNLEAISCYEKAIKLDPNLIDAYCNLAHLYMDSGKYEKALINCDQALNLSPGILKAVNIKSQILGRNVPNWHIAMMNDIERNNFYLTALKSVIKDNSSVLEIGTGSGLLSMMAAGLGAQEVNTCETNLIIANKAEEIIKDNNLSSKINVIAKKSNDMQIGRDMEIPANVLVSEIFSSTLLGEGVIPSIEDAKRRLISKSARIIPEYGSIMIALFGGKEIGKNIYTENFEKIKLKKFNSIIPRKHVVHREDLKIDLLSKSHEAFRFDFINKNNFFPESKKIEIESIGKGKCYGIIQWIKMEMDDGLKYENNPEKKTNASGWQRILYNFESPIELSPGQKLVIEGKHDKNLVWFFLDKVI